MTGANDVVANFGVLSEQFKTITKKINPEKIGINVADTIEELRQTMRKAGETFSQTTQLDPGTA